MSGIKLVPIVREEDLAIWGHKPQSRRQNRDLHRSLWHRFGGIIRPLRRLQQHNAPILAPSNPLSERQGTMRKQSQRHVIGRQDQCGRKT